MFPGQFWGRKYFPARYWPGGSGVVHVPKYIVGGTFARAVNIGTLAHKDIGGSFARQENCGTFERNK